MFVLRLPLIVSDAVCLYVLVYALHQHYVYTERKWEKSKRDEAKEQERVHVCLCVCERLTSIFLVKINSINFPFSLNDPGTKEAKIEKELNLKCVCVCIVGQRESEKVVCVCVCVRRQ